MVFKGITTGADNSCSLKDFPGTNGNECGAMGDPLAISEACCVAEAYSKESNPVAVEPRTRPGRAVSETALPSVFSWRPYCGLSSVSAAPEKTVADGFKGGKSDKGAAMSTAGTLFEGDAAVELRPKGNVDTKSCGDGEPESKDFATVPLAAEPGVSGDLFNGRGPEFQLGIEDGIARASLLLGIVFASFPAFFFFFLTRSCRSSHASGKNSRATG